MVEGPPGDGDGSWDGSAPRHADAHRVALRVAIAYTAVGLLWIFASSSLSEAMASDLATLASIERAKGVAYVLVTAAVAYAAVRWGVRSVLASRQHALEEGVRARVVAETTHAVWLEHDIVEGMVKDQPAWRDLTGQSFDEARGSGWLSCIAEVDRAAVAAMPGAGVTARVIARGGRPRTMLVRTLKPSSQSGRLLTLFTDITASVSDSDHDSLRNQLAVSQRFGEVGRISVGLAHDFNNQLSVILNAAELLRDERLSDHGKEDLRAIRMAASSAATLSKQLLAYARRRPGTAKALHVDATVEKLAPLLQRAAVPRATVEIDLRAASATVRVDRTMLEQALLNLVTNAHDAITTSGTIRIATRVKGGQLHLTVSDDGCGIAPELQERVFEPMFTGKASGTGLGLAIVKNTVVEASGRVELHSKLGEGSTFDLVLPCEHSEVAPPEQTSAPPPPPEEAGKARLLLVDDDAAVLRTMRRLLERAGYTVQVADSGERALELASQVPIDVLVCDVSMTGMSGPELLRRLGGRVPSVFVTGLAPEGVDVPAHSVVLQKPVSMAQLTTAITSVRAAGPVVDVPPAPGVPAG